MPAFSQVTTVTTVLAAAFQVTHLGFFSTCSGSEPLVIGGVKGATRWVASESGGVVVHEETMR